MPDCLRLAMWSGPRNISTAMMRAWGNRPDTVVCDEPLYAYYLLQTGVHHPGREEVIAAHECDWRKVVAWLTGPPSPRAGAAADQGDASPSGGARIFYQKHMAHHLLPEIGRDWLDALTHAFLIRDPAEMLASLIKVTPDPRIEDTGLPQQVELYDRIRAQTGAAPPVVDARDVLLDPRGVLTRLCARLGVDFREEMLHWPAGRRATDGVWARHWYAAVERSTGFEPYAPRHETLPARLDPLLSRCREYYAYLHQFRIV